MKKLEAIALLQKSNVEDDAELSIGNIVDILIGNAVTAAPEVDCTVITEADLEDFDPNDHLSKVEHLYKEVELRCATIKKKDIAKSYKDLKLPEPKSDDPRFMEQFDEAADSFFTKDGGIITMLELFDQIFDRERMLTGESPSDEWQISRLKYILDLPKVAFYNN